MAGKTKYYFIDFAIRPDMDEINAEEITEFVKDGKATENWLFMQIDASIGLAFYKYGMPDPKCVLVNRNYKEINEMHLIIVRNNLKDDKRAMKWNVVKMYIEDEIRHQTESNSDPEEGFIYSFEII